MSEGLEAPPGEILFPPSFTDAAHAVINSTPSSGDLIVKRVYRLVRGVITHEFDQHLRRYQDAPTSVAASVMQDMILPRITVDRESCVFASRQNLDSLCCAEHVQISSCGERELLMRTGQLPGRWLWGMTSRGCCLEGSESRNRRNFGNVPCTISVDFVE